jgi:hypothetical protein
VNVRCIGLDLTEAAPACPSIVGGEEGEEEKRQGFHDEESGGQTEGGTTVGE